LPIWNNSELLSWLRFRNWGIFELVRSPVPGGRCGTAGCHCHRSPDPGHDLHPRLTYKVNGRTVTESFPTPAAQRKAEREIETFHRYWQLERSFVEVNQKIC
jgi:hypothetical protein